MSKAEKYKARIRAKTYKHLKLLEVSAAQSQSRKETTNSGDEETDRHGGKKLLRTPQRKRRARDRSPPLSPAHDDGDIPIVPIQAKEPRLPGPPTVLLERPNGSIPNRREQEGVAIQAIQLAVSNSDPSSSLGIQLPNSGEVLGSDDDDEMSDTPPPSKDYFRRSNPPASSAPSTSIRPPEPLDKGKSKELPTGSPNDGLDEHLQALYNSGSEKAAYETVCTLLQQLLIAQKEIADMQKQLANSPPSVPASRSNRGDQENQSTQAAKRKDHRDIERNAILGCIRQKFYTRLGREGPDDPLPPVAPPEVIAPSDTTFGLRYHESETSVFNKMAVLVVLKEIKREWPAVYAKFGDGEMMKMGTAHVKYLSKLYKRQNDPWRLSKEEARKRHCATDTRKRSLYYQRLKAIQELPGLHRHGRLVEALGIDGTSSDEEDPDVPGTYIIKRRRPLSESVHHLFGKIDQAYVLHFKGPGSKGNQVRRRVDKGVLSTRKFEITGIPVSCINPDWFRELSEEHRQLLEFTPIEYDFTFPVALLQPLPV